jgi:hypothetical protein
MERQELSFLIQINAWHARVQTWAPSHTLGIFGGRVTRWPLRIPGFLKVGVNRDAAPMTLRCALEGPTGHRRLAVPVRE